ncbi:enhanced intracellular survival protein Eis [Mycobacterium sp. PSTR-4-N]|uniref:enhanced intracellular survival protein Eis n=1 Tax=Mycobacterium sp. PSTR-4-N TaxID=2917745 RepID=UPI001F1525D3|nr:enhanced intracellular survival protein Eis [Mycobacterium sp. PSTR-4-N]MCG7594245.1 enhanced intracellular survival protein Eis [Mycobacterium sp. PSTR-4-N]
MSTITFRSAVEADWPAMGLITAAAFGFQQPEQTAQAWRSLIASDGAVVACDGDDVVGTAVFLDLELTVPGGAVLPMAGVSMVAVAPTHRRRGALSGMLDELHRRMDAYPIAGLEASEAEIYGRFGYGPATVWERLEVHRRGARVHRGVPDPGGVRIVRPVEHRAQLEDIDERWRLRTPGGLHTPARLWDEVLADREESRSGGTQRYCLLHRDGYAFYRLFGSDEKTTAEVTKFAAVTAEAEIALWRVLLGLDLKKVVGIHTHPDSVLRYLMTDPRLARTTDVFDGLWLRMLDIPAVLQARTYSTDLSVVFEVSDEFLGRGGRFAVTVRNGRARCERTGAAADVHLDVSVLGSLYLGTHRASSFAAAQRLRCSDTGVVIALDKAFATDVPAELGFGF